METNNNIFTYEINNNNTISITGLSDGLEKLTEITIPEEIDGKKVTRIDEYAFEFCESLKSVMIPDGVTTIERFAFSDCTSLERVILPDSVKAIEHYAFYGCRSLESVLIPNPLTEIGIKAFPIECEVIIRNDKEDKAMEETNIFEYEINDNGTINITGLNIESRKLTELVIPEEINGKKVTKIGHHAFCQCTSIERVIIPDSVTEIKHYAFYDCRSLKEIIIPNSVVTIAHHAFCDCTSLERVILPNSIKEIEYSTFNDCAALKSIIIPSGVTRIGSYAFHCCTSLSSVTIPDTVKEINQNAFGYCKSLERVILPDGFLMEDDSFPSECKLIGYNKDNKEDKSMIDNNIFVCILNKDDTISIIGLSEGLEKLTDIDIPAEIDGKKVTKIWKFAFYDCPLLESVTIPNTVTEIGYGAFRFCKSLKSVVIPNPSAKVDINAFPVECEVIVGKDNDDKNDERVDYGKLISEMDKIKDAVSYAHELINKSTDIIRAFGKDKELSGLEDPKDFDRKMNEYIVNYNKAYMDAITALIDVLKLINAEDRNTKDSFNELLDATTAHVNNMLVMLVDDKKKLDDIWSKLAEINSMASAIDDMLERIDN